MRFRRRLTVLSVATIVAAAGLVPTAPKAAAILGCPNPDGFDHCYGVASFGDPASEPPIYMNGLSTELTVDCLEVTSPGTDFVNFEMWMYTNSHIPDSSTWLEAGMTHGTLWAAQGQPTGFVWFWADERALSGPSNYHEHLMRNARHRETGVVSFYWVQGTDDWRVFEGPPGVPGTAYGRSVGVGAWAGGAEVGAEATRRAVHVVGRSRNWLYENLSWQWVPPLDTYLINDSRGLWALSGGGQRLNVTTPLTQPGCQPALNAPSAPASAAADGVPVAEAELLKTFEKVAAHAGANWVQDVQLVRTTRRQANALTGTQVTGDQSVVMLQTTGSFTRPAASNSTRERGEKTRTAPVLTATIDADTGQLQDWGISPATYNLARLGTVSTRTIAARVSS